MTQAFEDNIKIATSSQDEAQTKKIRKIQVIFLRHGEREDETADYDAHEKTRQERIDPALTVLGHQQALGAWRKILAYVPKDKPIMVACSPLRRCVGTAMMVAAAAASNNSAETGLKFVLPTEDVNAQEQMEDAIDTTTDEETASVSTIPMLVMNGLGDCAAQMRHMGGIGKAVKAGWLACAASPGNDCLDPDDATTPLQTSLHTIASNATNLQSRWGSHTPMESCKLQFWRESNYHYYESTPSLDFAKMTEPRTLQQHAGSGNGASTSGSDPHRMPKNAPSCDERFDLAVARAVLQTAHAGLDTCILVTHREAIRSIEKHWNRPLEAPPKTAEELEQYKNKHRRDPKLQATRTYCCVGEYQVSLDLTHSGKPRILSWESKKVVPWPELEKDQD